MVARPPLPSTYLPPRLLSRSSFVRALTRMPRLMELTGVPASRHSDPQAGCRSRELYGLLSLSRARLTSPAEEGRSVSRWPDRPAGDPSRACPLVTSLPAFRPALPPERPRSVLLDSRSVPFASRSVILLSGSLLLVSRPSPLLCRRSPAVSLFFGFPCAHTHSWTSRHAHATARTIKARFANMRWFPFTCPDSERPAINKIAQFGNPASEQSIPTAPPSRQFITRSLPAAGLGPGLCPRFRGTFRPHYRLIFLFF
jgi:hypothetical protein